MLPIGRLHEIWPEWSVEELIGEGSFGKVYRAVHVEQGVSVYSAIKIISIPQTKSELDSIRSEGFDENGTRRYFERVVNDFTNEIRLMHSLKGVQNIVGVEDFRVIEKKGEIGWDIFIRMELLTPFNAFLGSRTLSEAEVIRLGTDICTALEICGKRNIIHRDIKPENIFVNDLGFYKLGDFGIARKMENMTGDLSQKGSPNYMAPEVANSTSYDARVDIYSLGIVLYRLLNRNRLPFLDSDGQNMSPNARKLAVERRLRGEPLPPPSDASAEMSRLILRACAYDPAQRFSSASEMKRALENVGRGTYCYTRDELNRTGSALHTAPDLDATASVRHAAQDLDATTSVRHAAGAKAGKSAETFGAKKSNAPKIAAIIAAVLLCAAVAVTLIPGLTEKSGSDSDSRDQTEGAERKQELSVSEPLPDSRNPETVPAGAQLVQEPAADESAQAAAYAEAEAMLQSGLYDEAIAAFSALGGYRDSAQQAELALQRKEQAAQLAADYQAAEMLFAQGDYAAAAEAYSRLGDYADAPMKLQQAQAALEEAEQYILPKSASELVTTEDLRNLSHRELCLARNEIYARHGRIFATPEIAAYFATKSWYSGTISGKTFDANQFSILNEVEQANTRLILEYENRYYGGSFY